MNQLETGVSMMEIYFTAAKHIDCLGSGGGGEGGLHCILNFKNLARHPFLGQTLNARVYSSIT